MLFACMCACEENMDYLHCKRVWFILTLPLLSQLQTNNANCNFDNNERVKITLQCTGVRWLHMSLLLFFQNAQWCSQIEHESIIPLGTEQMRENKMYVVDISLSDITLRKKLQWRTFGGLKIKVNACNKLVEKVSFMDREYVSQMRGN